MSKVATLFIDLRASATSFFSDIGKVDKKFADLSKRMAGVGKAMSSALTVPLAGIGVAAFAAANKFDDAFDDIRAGTGATGKALEELQNSFREVLSGSTQGTEEVSNVIAKLSKGLGLTGKPLEDLSHQVLGLAQVTNQDLGAAVSGTTKIMNAWGVQTKDQGATMDFLFKVVQATGVQFGALAEDVAKFQPIMSQLGFGLKESAALFGQLEKAGADSGKVMSGFQQAVAKFAKAGIKDTAGALKLTFDAIKNAPNATVAAADAMEVFGKKAGPQLAALIRDGKLSIDEFVKSLDSNSETIGKAVADTDGFAESWMRFKNNIQLALEPIGTPLLDVLNKALNAINPQLKAFGEAFAGLDPNIKLFVIGLGAAVAATGPLLLAFSGIVKIGGTLIPFFATLGSVIATTVITAMEVLTGVLAALLSPLGAVAAAVGVAIAAWYEWDKIGPILSAVGDNILAFFQGVYDSFAQLAPTAAASIEQFAQDVIAGFTVMKDTCLQIVGDMVTGITDWFTGKFESAKQSVQSFADDTVAIFQGMYDTLVGHSIVPDTVQEIGANMAQLPGLMSTPVQAATSGVITSFAQLKSAIGQSSKSGVDSAKQLGDAWKKTESDIKGVLSDINHEADPLRQQITGFLKAGDSAGLNKLAETFRGSKEQLDQFRSSLKDGAQDFNTWSQNQAHVTESIKDMNAQLYEIQTGKTYIDSTTQSIIALMEAGDMTGIQSLGQAMAETSDGAQEFDKSLSTALGVMRDMKQQSDQLAQSIGGALSQAFGLDSSSANFFGKGITDAIGSLFGGQSGKNSIGGMLGDAVKGMFSGSGSGGGPLSGLSSLFGGSGGSSSGGGGIMSAISSLFGGGSGGGTSGVGPVADGSQYASLLGMPNQLSSLTDLFKNSGMGGAGGAGSYMSVIADSLSSIVQIGKSTKGTVTGLGQLGGTTIGAIFGGPMGAQIGGAIGKAAGSFLGKFFGGGPKNKDTIARNSAVDQLNKLLKDHPVQMVDPAPFSGSISKPGSGDFNKPGWGDQMNASPNGGTFSAIGKGLTGLLGISEDVGSQIGKVLFDNMGGSIDNLRLMVQGLGVSMQQMTDYFVQQAEKGTISWYDMEVSLQGVNDAFGKGLQAVGDYGKAFDIIIQSGGEGMNAINGLKDSAIEAGEAGITSFAQWAAALKAAGKDTTYVDTLMQALSQRGITSFQQLSNASDRELGGVIADMQALSPALMTAWKAAQDAAKGVGDAIKDIPNPTDIQLNVDANISDSAQQALALANSSGSIQAPKAFATGGIVKKPTLGMIGEAGPEAVVPLGRLGAMMSGVGSMGKGGNTYNIDARGAAPGVERDIMRAIEMSEERAVRRSVQAVADGRDRGGSFADSF